MNSETSEKWAIFMYMIVAIILIWVVVASSNWNPVACLLGGVISICIGLLAYSIYKE
jgi:hypothetical protein